MARSMLTKIFSSWRKQLMTKSAFELNELLDKQWKWAGYDEDPDIEILAGFETAKGRRNKTDKVEWLLNYDPIFADGGLNDFLIENGVKAEK